MTSAARTPTTDVPPDPQVERRRRERMVFGAGVVAQMAIVVTGGLVRVTDSGLGCPTWPQCVPGSYVPVSGQPQHFHKLVEFGNRTLTFFVVLVVLACVVTAWRRTPRRRSLVLLSAVGVVGVAGQAVLGGVSVLTDLNPFVVAGHFLLSMPLVAAALAVYERSADDGDEQPVPLVRREVRLLAFALVAVGALVLVIGTLVTGSGPHSGDGQHPARTGFDPERIAWLHADVVVLFLGLVIALLLALRLTDAPARPRGRAVLLLVVTLLQGALGYLQFFTGVPWVLVAFHVLGAVLLWWAVLRVPYTLRTRSDVAAPTG